MALSFLDSTSKLLQQLDLLDRDPVPRNMEGEIADELMDVPDTPDRLATLGRINRENRNPVFEKVNYAQTVCRRDDKTPMQIFEEEVRASIKPNLENVSSLLLSKEIPRRQRSNCRPNANGGCWPSVSLCQGQGSSHFQYDSGLHGMEDNLEAEALVDHACPSDDFDNLDLAFPTSESGCSNNLFDRYSVHERVAMENCSESCSGAQIRGSRTLNRRGRLSLQRKKIPEVDTGPMLLPLQSQGQAEASSVVPGTSFNFDESCFHQGQNVGSGSSLQGVCPVDRAKLSGNSFDGNIRPQVDNISYSDGKVEAFSKEEVVQLSSAGLCRKNPSASKYPSISRGRSAIGNCHFSSPQKASSGVISTKLSPKENVNNTGTSALFYGKSNIVHVSGPVDDPERRGKLDLKSPYCIRSTKDAQAKKHHLSGQVDHFDYKLDYNAPKGTNDEKQSGIVRHVNRRAINIDQKSSNHIQEIELCGDSLPKPRATEVSSLHSTSLPKQTRGRRLVRNGCISPINIARMNRISNEGNKKVLDNKQGASGERDVSENYVTKESSEWHKVDKKKGKEIMIESMVADTSDSHKHQGRKELTFTQEPINGLHTCDTHDTFMEDLQGWGNTNSSLREISLDSPPEDEVFLGSSDHVYESILSGRENLSNEVHFDLDNGSNDACTLGLLKNRFDLPPVKAASDMPPNNERKSRGGRTLMKRQRRSSSIANNYQQGEGSSTSYVGPEVAQVQACKQPLHVFSTRRSRNRQASRIFENVIEIDDSSSPRINTHSREVNSNCASEDDGGAKARQMEADETLARQLQEQFYREAAGGGNSEMDASIAWTLQEEENAQNAPSPFIFNEDLPFHRVSTATSLGRPFLLRSSENSSVWTRSRPTTNNSRLAQLRRSIHYRSSTPHSGRRLRFPSNMSLEMRIQLLEALDGIVGADGSFADGFLTTERDFTENDYEMLLALDNDNDRHTGASVEQINRLPLSQIQADNFGEACAVCLETPSIGDQIRHLPCLHKFHKECIDPWLRRRPSCPICKSSIGGGC